MKFSVVLPCKDEEKTVGGCIDKAKKALPGAEIIVVDNNSHDKSAAIARKYGAIVIRERIDGYGAALLRGFDAAKGDYIIMCDADGTYDLNEAKKLIKYRNRDIVIGNRFGNMKKGSMDLLHKYVGNPVLSFIMRTFFKVKVKDAHSGFRMIKKRSLEKLKLDGNGMEIASEMLIKAAKHKMKIKEIPISYYPRQGISKLNTFKDGWKHLRLMLLYSPDYLFLVPGILLLLIGFTIMALLLNGPIYFGNFKIDFHPMILGSLLTILGYQIILLWFYTKTYGIIHLGEKDRLLDRIHKIINLEKGIFIGLAALAIGVIIAAVIMVRWLSTGFGALFEIRNSIFAFTLIVIGIQTIFSSFFLSIIGARRSS
jgi:glycosyltransferase involved in cell wall biosynthesis